MRIRALKPGFFKSEELAELSPWHRLCFQGLWLCADRDGRMQDRPKRLKAEIFPYDDLDMNALIWDLANSGFVVRYQIGAQPYLWIPTWAAHQHPRPDEGPSQIPAYEQGSDRKGGPEVPVLKAVLATDTGKILDSVLSSDAPVSPARIGSGRWEVGNGTLEVGIAAEPPQAPEAPHLRAQDLMDLWNATTKPPIPRCRELTDDRRRKIRLRLAKRPAFGEWREAFEYLTRTAFYTGSNDRSWVADFDYVLKNDTVVTRLLERAREVVPASPNNKRISGLVAGGQAFLNRGRT